MQSIVEELVRWVGYAVLRTVTLGTYRGGTEDDRLPEGAVGLGVLIAVVGVATYAW